MIVGFIACDRISGLRDSNSSSKIQSALKGGAAGSQLPLTAGNGIFNYYTFIPGVKPNTPNHAQSYPTTATTANDPTLYAIDYPDVRVHHDPAGDTTQAEVHISINPNNSDNMIISANTIPFAQGYYVSFDRGNTWQGANQLPHIHVADSVIAGDPSTAFDASGHAFISSLHVNSSPAVDGYDVLTSQNGGNTWNAPSFVLPSAEVGSDKEMIAADNYSGSPYVNNLYGAWDVNASIEFNRPSDVSSPITLSGSRYGKGAVIATGPNGDVYVCWEDWETTGPPSKGVMFAKLTNGGRNFNGASLAFSVNGMDPNGGGPDPKFNGTRVNDFPSIAVDQSIWHYGRIYIAYAEEVSGSSVIRVRYSDNEGGSWSSPVTVSANGYQAWFPWIAVARSSGFVSIVYYLEDASYNTTTWVAYSENGQTFRTSQVSDVSHKTEPIDPHSKLGINPYYAGDYIGITAQDSSAWADQRNGMWQIYVSRVDYPLGVMISGPTGLINGEQGTWTAQAYGGIPSYYYHWQYYYVCKTAAQPDYPGGGKACGQWFDGGTSSTFSLTGSTIYAGVNVKVTVTDGVGGNKTVEAAFCQFY